MNPNQRGVSQPTAWMHRAKIGLTRQMGKCRLEPPPPSPPPLPAWEGQGSRWATEFSWLPDVLCIKMGFSKTRKSH